MVLMTPRDGKIKQVTSYHPKFTYPIFGEEERIFGYKNLRINLLFNSSDMRPNLNITYSKKFQAIGETEPADIPEILKDFLPPGRAPHRYDICRYRILTRHSGISTKKGIPTGRPIYAGRLDSTG